MPARHNLRYSGIIACLLLPIVAGCGGGGGGGPSSSCVIRTADHGCVSNEDFEDRRNEIANQRLADPEFVKQWGLQAVNAHKAHAAIAVVRGEDVEPGAGVGIGVIDSGVDLGHPELDGASLTETLLQGVPDEIGTIGDGSHGTTVTSVIAAQPDGENFVGIAWGADVKVFAVPLDGSYPENYDSGSFDWAQAYETVLASDVDIVNVSISRTGGLFVENYVGHTKEQIYNMFPELAVAAQNGVEDPTIVVWAAGNDHGVSCVPSVDENCNVDLFSPGDGLLDATSPNLDTGAAALLDDLRGHTVVVVAIGENGRIADFSNRCGIAANWCIAAPGVGIETAYFGPSNGRIVRGYVSSSGTSYAAPMVSGGLALMKQMFRGQLSNTDLVTRLFATADKSGIYAVGAVYGQGLIDLEAAVTPVGEARVATGARVGDAGHRVHATRLALGGALGDGLSHALAGREIAAFDALGAPFWYDLPDLAGAAPRPSTAARLRGLLAPGAEIDAPAPGGTRLAFVRRGNAVEQGGWRFGLYESPANAESSLFNLAENAATFGFRARNGLEATAFTTVGMLQEQTPETGAVLAWRPRDEPFGMRLGWLGEQEAMLGSMADGAFGRLSADSFVAGFEAGGAFAGWRLAADAELGLVAPSAGGGVISRMSGLTTSAVSLRADRRLSDNDAITVSLSQPPRVEHGRARLTLPIGRTRNGAVLRESVSADLVPSGRQVDLAARWRRTGAFGGEFRTEAYVSHSPGHAADAKPVLGLLAGWRAAF